MADETTGGTVLGFPGLMVPGAVGEGGPPTLAPLTGEFAPPASLSVPESPALGGAAETAAHGMEAAPAAGPGSLAGVAAMSSVMMAGITVAALRGAYHAVGYLKARAEHFKSVRDQQEAVTGKANSELEKAWLNAFTAQQRGRMQSGPEFGRASKNPAPNSGQNSGVKNSSAPAAMKQGPVGKPLADTAKKPEVARKGGLDARAGAAGSPGPGAMQDARRKALEASGKSGRPGPNSGPEKGPKDRSGKQLAAPDTIRGAARQRAAARIAGGPAPKTPKQPSPPDTLRGAARQRAANRITNGPTPKTPKTPKQPLGPDTIRGAARHRAADRINTGSWKPTGAHQGSGTTPTTIRGALRTRAAGRILNGKKAKAQAAQPGTPTPPGPKVNLTKTPKAPGATGAAGAAGAAGAGGTAAGAAAGAAGRKARRRARPKPRATVRPKARARSRSKAKARSSKAGSAQGQWQRAGTRKSQAAGGTSGPTAGSAAGGFGPPPGWGHTQGPTVTYSQANRPGSHTAGAIGSGPTALPRAPYISPHARPGTTRPGPTQPPAGGPPVTIPAPRAPHGTQYADSDLTIGDVIEADADMAEEIMQGADDARLAAEGCESLLGGLEALHAMVLELKVPGVLEGMVAWLIEQAGLVQAKAEAVAEAIPGAAEAIAQAGHNAERRDKPVADVVRDQGHIAPAEREYHEE
ncbi:hypothetical protein GCM10009760_53150 [Kitasatospora kazusensis]|uniref:Uncharacterized protein n=2 Tax=Kitasatospora kazusensis TaxID=407974 RepID=A0ABN3A5I5_9ACTN